MVLPPEVPVMTLPNATLFPQALLPLYIFEPRYRRMLADALHTHRMFIVAMQKPGSQRESPVPVAGLGLIRVSVGHQDGTSHLVLQGLTRVQLTGAVRYRPYRVDRIQPLVTPPTDTVVLDALAAKVRELVAVRLSQGFQFPFSPFGDASSGSESPPGSDTSPVSVGDILSYLDGLKDPGQLADLVACALLPGAGERQTILTIVQLEARLQRLIRFLSDQVEIHQQDSPS
jgi:ATP-dependent Lon protease